jgi:hypothetical protein
MGTDLLVRSFLFFSRTNGDFTMSFLFINRRNIVSAEEISDFGLSVWGLKQHSGTVAKQESFNCLNIQTHFVC